MPTWPMNIPASLAGFTSNCDVFHPSVRIPGRVSNSPTQDAREPLCRGGVFEGLEARNLDGWTVWETPYYDRMEWAV